MNQVQAQRFWEKVKQVDDCWIWTACIDHDGYGDVKIAGRRTRAHRAAYEHMVTTIPDGLVIDHLCRVRACVNPSHMDPVPNRVNVIRGDSRTNQQSAQTCCKFGHPFSESNTYIRPNGSRKCKQCGRDISARYRATLIRKGVAS